MKRIKVPDIKHPTLCFKQEVVNNVITTFERCGYPKGHAGRHQWETRKDRK